MYYDMRPLITILLILLASPVSAASWRFDGSRTRLVSSVEHVTLGLVRVETSSVSGSIEAGEDGPRSISATVSSAGARLIQPRSGLMSSLLGSLGGVFPSFRFTSASIERLGPERFRARGSLTIGSVTRPMSLQIRWPADARSSERRAHASGHFSRSAFTRAPGAALLFKDDVGLDIDAVLIKQR